jgi:hypothetical protein
MSYTLEMLAHDIRLSLLAQPGEQGRERCRAFVERALADQEFVRAVFPVERAAAREVLFEDPELGFCICAHVFNGDANGKPHDHGPSWAIYGQVAGTTEMTDWRVRTPARGDEPALVEPVATYELRPGQAHYYEVGAVHSPARSGETKLLRIEGQNLEGVHRSRYQAA